MSEKGAARILELEKRNMILSKGHVFALNATRRTHLPRALRTLTALAALLAHLISLYVQYPDVPRGVSKHAD